MWILVFLSVSASAIAARIFVHRLEAELVSIAGRYLVSDHIGIEHFGQPTQVLLQDDRVTIVRS